ncbi:hypothetical protein LPB140_02390 [Sphingorhabdus lutea]|uniref:DUF4230 domain-containing protein n=1 Tax=Sphingorhabdus lutea TaxID=1913578 RepID=A0A1L3J9V3_9SPHN|nr:DUF4230 domain-containing protein [Sphingorhabdus lutea]APG61863.1 hypothetical protein LPB140_02390 [Sphingorhabdus lutea]
MDASLKKYLPLLALILLIFGGGYWLTQSWQSPKIESVVGSTLNAVQEQNSLTIFTNKSTATVTTTQSKYGLSAKKTLIVSGLVRYEVNMAKLSEDDLRWDKEKQTLYVRIPPIDIGAPQIDLSSVQIYGEGGILRTFTNVDELLDRENNEKAQAELVAQAKSPVLMDLARASAKKAISANFTAPLQAAGLDAKVAPFFEREEDRANKSRWDVSTPIKDVMRDKEK